MNLVSEINMFNHPYLGIPIYSLVAAGAAILAVIAFAIYIFLLKRRVAVYSQEFDAAIDEFNTDCNPGHPMTDEEWGQYRSSYVVVFASLMMLERGAVGIPPVFCVGTLTTYILCRMMASCLSIINVMVVLQQYARVHINVSMLLHLTGDEDICQNNGYCKIENGSEDRCRQGHTATALSPSGNWPSSYSRLTRLGCS